MIFKIKWIENKTSAKGNTYAKATLMDEKGVETTDVTIFGTYPGFADMRPETSVEGQLKPSVYNGKTSHTLEKMVVAPDWATKGPAKAGMSGAVKAAEITSKSVDKSQVRKDEGIKTSGTMRDAVQIALAELGNLKDHTEYERRIIYWREWLLKNWEIDSPPF